MSLVRDASPPREVRDLARDPIRFLHPGYPKPLNILFSLPRNDPAIDSNTFGVHHATALTACQIIANNAFNQDSYLCRDAEGHLRVDASQVVLTEPSYWFHISADSK